MTDLQQLQLAILKDFVRACEALGLTYFLVYGSALGAVRHGGFIPWDDDVDVALPREDYEIFCEKAQRLLPKDLFLQNHRADKYFPFGFSKLRNSATTFIEKSCDNLNIHHGVYIDVFPLDGYPEDKRLQKKVEREKRRYDLSRLCCLHVPLNSRTRLLVFVQRLLGLHRRPDKLVSRLERHVAYPARGAAVWCNHGIWQGGLEYADRAQYGEGAWASFEGLRVRIPEKIDEYLTQNYGDWRTFPPEEKREGHHYYRVCDLSTPYKDVITVISDRTVAIKEEYR